MSAELRTATAMAFRDQLRRPLVVILLALFPAFDILWSVAITEPTPHAVQLPGGAWVTTTMKALHGPEMAKISVAFVAALVGVFVMQSALQGDRRLVLAGYRERHVVLARMAVLATATVAVVAVSALLMALNFTPASWSPVIVALVLAGLIYAAIGALAGALLDRLPATFLILFLSMTDFGVVQTPMFHPKPATAAWLLPGYGPTRAMFDGAYSTSFHAAGELAIALGWLIALAVAVYVVLRHSLGARA